MARFVAYGAAYSHGVQSEVAEPTPYGKRVVERSLEAQFTTNGITPFEIETGAKSLQIHGLPEDRIEGGEVSPQSRLSVFDSERAARDLRWSEDDHEKVLQTLRESDRYGLDFIEIEHPKRPAPWKGYDRLKSVAKIAELAVATGSDLKEVIAYERENEDREEVVAALEELLGDDAEEEVVLDAG